MCVIELSRLVKVRVVRVATLGYYRLPFDRLAWCPMEPAALGLELSLPPNQTSAGPTAGVEGGIPLDSFGA